MTVEDWPLLRWSLGSAIAVLHQRRSSRVVQVARRYADGTSVRNFQRGVASELSCDLRLSVSLTALTLVKDSLNMNAPKVDKKAKPDPNSKASKMEIISMGDDGYDHAAAPSLDQKVRVVGGKGEFQARYTKGRELGLGAFSNVFLGTHRASRKEYAVKKIDREKMIWGDSRDALEDEVNHLIIAREGPNIVQLYEVYEEKSHCYLVMELMHGGELFDRILERKNFTEKEARDCIRSVLTGLEYLHEKRLAHRDLKPENLLLTGTSDTSVKLADFGFSKVVKKVNGLRTLCGTPGYLAPEASSKHLLSIPGAHRHLTFFCPCSDSGTVARV